MTNAIRKVRAQPPPIIDLPRFLYLSWLSNLIPPKSSPRLPIKIKASRPQGPIQCHQDVTCCHCLAVKSATPTTRITAPSLGSQLVPTISSNEREGFLGTGLATLAKVGAALGGAGFDGVGGGAAGAVCGTGGRCAAVGGALAAMGGCVVAAGGFATGSGGGGGGGVAGFVSGVVTRTTVSAAGGLATAGWLAGFETATVAPQRVQKTAAGISTAPHLAQVAWAGAGAATDCAGDTGGAGTGTDGAGFSVGFGATRGA